MRHSVPALRSPHWKGGRLIHPLLGYSASAAQRKRRPRGAYLCPSSSGHYPQPVPDGGEYRGEIGQAEQDPEPHQRLVGCIALVGAGAWDTTGEARKMLICGAGFKPVSSWFTSLLPSSVRASASPGAINRCV